MTRPSSLQRKVADIQRQFKELDQRRYELQSEMDRITEARIDLVMDLRGCGFTNTEMASLLTLSPGRVSQLVQKRRQSMEL